MTLLDDKAHIHRLPDRYSLVKEGEQLNKLFFVIHGSIAGYKREISGAKKERKAFFFDIEHEKKFLILLFKVLCLLIELMKSVVLSVFLLAVCMMLSMLLVTKESC